MATWQSEPWLLKVFRGFNQWKTRLNHLLNNHLLPVQIDRGAFKCCAMSDNGDIKEHQTLDCTTKYINSTKKKKCKCEEIYGLYP